LVSVMAMSLAPYALALNGAGEAGSARGKVY
jgi:hypothetical protein